MALIGVGICIGGALVFTQFMSNMLFEVTSFDPATLALISVVIIILAMLASYLPVVKTTKVNPIIALRSEELYPTDRFQCAGKPSFAFGITSVMFDSTIVEATSTCC